MLSARFLPAPSVVRNVRYASRLRSTPRSLAARPRNGRNSPTPKAAPSQPQPTTNLPPSPPSISETLRDTDPSHNSLLAPVHIPEDEHAVLKENHPAANILRNSGLVVQRQLEMMNVFLGFEQANKYVIMDGHGQHVGFMAETDGGLGRAMLRQTFRTHRAFTTHIFDREQREVLRFNRPFSWINSRIGVYDPLTPAAASASSQTALATNQARNLVPDTQDSNISSLPLSEMRVIGEAQQQWAPLRRKYNLFLYHHPTGQLSMPQLPVAESQLSRSQQLQVSDGSDGQYTQFAMVDEPFLSWDFSLLSADKQLIGSVNRNFAGFGRELFTDTGVYALRMDSAGLAEPLENEGQSLLRADSVPAMTLDQRAVMLATAVSIDFDYFSRHSGHGGMWFMPMWWGGGEAAGAGAAGAAGVEGAGAAGAAGAAEGTGAVVGGTAGTLGRAAGGASGAGEGAMAGAGTLAGYEIMQRGSNGEPQAPHDGQPYPPQDGQWPPPQETQPGEEDVWGQNDDPWNQGPGGSSGGGGDSGGGGGGGFDISDWFS